ncbi:MAG: metalloregulator ArsR/SmtB family transcription factor [Nocardioides sp.]
MQDDVFKALADPTRRAILDLLFVRDGQSVGEVCGELADQMSRFGVMKHLAVLEEANLITTQRQGRTKLLYLNPVPIEQIADRWIAKYAARFSSALVELKTSLEAPNRPPAATKG